MSQLKRELEAYKFSYQDILCAVIVEESESEEVGYEEHYYYLQKGYTDSQLQEFISNHNRCEANNSLSTYSLIWLKDLATWLELEYDCDYDTRFWTSYSYPPILPECSEKFVIF